jgi:glycosyltransferase involved in cell wall biosynthesis
VFALARAAKPYCQVVAVPNLEIVRLSELRQHAVFDKILCNNQFALDAFTKADLPTRAMYLGFVPVPVQRPPTVRKVPAEDRPVRYLLVGGRNAVSRKNVELVLRAVPLVKRSFVLRVTSQKELPTRVMRHTGVGRAKRVEFVVGDIPQDQLNAHYEWADVVFQVSRHEGLGLGFFEPLQFGKPVVSLDTPPHSEIIRDSVNGWLLKPVYSGVTEQQESLVNAAGFKPSELARLMETITLEKVHALRVTEDYESRFKYDEFCDRFTSLLLQ